MLSTTRSAPSGSFACSALQSCTGNAPEGRGEVSAWVAAYVSPLPLPRIHRRSLGSRGTKYASMNPIWMSSSVLGAQVVAYPHVREPASRERSFRDVGRGGETVAYVVYEVATI
jgi:hypothetical protein